MWPLRFSSSVFLFLSFIVWFVAICAASLSNVGPTQIHIPLQRRYPPQITPFTRAVLSNGAVNKILLHPSNSSIQFAATVAGSFCEHVTRVIRL